ncbi:MAG: hypothetical protein CMJ48_08785 [Planctomycetaceae bacterium]|nr:hypothetical protein [Planctomycetaceae bacterium]
MLNQLVECANVAGDRWIPWFLAPLLDSTALLAVLGLIWLGIRKRVGPQVGYCLFLLVPLKLLLPVAVAVPAEVARWTPSTLVASLWNDATRESQTIEARNHRDSQPVTVDLRSAELTTAAADASHPPRPQLVTAPEVSSAAELASSPTMTSATSLSPADTPRLSARAIAMILWLAGVLLLAARFARAQLRFRATSKRFSPVDALPLDVELHNLCRRIGISRTIRFVESDHLTVPSVWGIFRPTVILPRGIVSSLTPTQLRWVLLHELAHVRRRDLLVVAFQRCAAVLHFVNPAVWIANRIVHRLREYACDDLAVSLTDGSPIECGNAFVHILRDAVRNQREPTGALGVFGLDSKASCTRRVRRLIDSERRIHTRVGPWSFCGLLLMAALSLPQLRAAHDPGDADASRANKQPTKSDRLESKPAADATTAKRKNTFQLHVVGPDGKSVAQASIGLRTSPSPTAEQIERGDFVRKTRYGTFVKTDANGRLVVRFPQKPSRFNVSIKTPGYGPYWASWSSQNHPQAIPSKFTANLDAGWSVGGIIVDEEGNPIEGVGIHPSIKYKKRPGDKSQLGVGSVVKTDARGRWRFDNVPVSKSQVWVEIKHAEYMPNRRALTRSEFGIALNQKPAALAVLERGLTVTGKVTDEAGQPIAGALIRTKFLNDIREAKTNAGGIYHLNGCEPRMARIVVSAKDRATDMKELRIDPEMDPVDFRMQPGGKIRIRVVDAKGNPLPKARIFFQRWRGRFSYFEFDHVSQYADENGVWEWNEAPLDEFKADICRPGGMELGAQPLLARDEEYVFRPPPALVMTGKVIDAETKKPIKKFRVIPGVRSSETHMNWVRGGEFTVTEGRYEMRRTHDYFAYLFRIEADGYRPAVSRDIKSNEGQVTIDFALKRGQDITALVLRPDGAPAEGAKVALGVTGAQISIKNGDIDDGSTLCTQQDVGPNGRFRFAQQSTLYQLVITHPTGYAHVKATPKSVLSTIKLTAWAKVHGTFRVGKQTMANVPITINSRALQSSGRNEPNIHTHHDVTTGRNGRFVFERVMPGPARIGRRIMLTVDDGALDVTSAGWVAENFATGKTTRIDLGGAGRPVVGVLEPPKGVKGRVNWNFALVSVRSHLPTPPQPVEPPIPAGIKDDPQKLAAWMLKWQLTPAGQAWTAWRNAYEATTQLRAAAPLFRATVDRDGTFRIDDMPAGSYSLSLRFSRDAVGRLSSFRFVVPPMNGARSDQRLNLGVLTLQ